MTELNFDGASMKPVPMKLCDLLSLANVEVLEIVGSPVRMVSDVTLNSSRVMEDCLFAAIRGSKNDGHHFLSDAVERGARTLLVDKEIREYPGTTMVRVTSSREAFGKIAHALFGNPGHGMKLAAVTGTNGKTSTAWILKAILESVGQKSAMIGTLGTIFESETIFPSLNTTPDARALAEHFAVLKSLGADSVVMEASSHGIDQERVSGIQFDTSALTNITRDHLDYHHSFEDYVAAKTKLFTKYLSSTGKAVLNLDDSSGFAISEAEKFDRITFGRGSGAEIRIESVTHFPARTGFALQTSSGKIEGCLPMPGEFSVANAAAAIGMALTLGLTCREIEEGLKNVRPVPGRFEAIDGAQPFLVAVDYAHTPDALDQTLSTARRLTSGRMICVFGCGGDRDQAKRPLMARAVERHCDFAVLTSDNPRNEDPLEIVRDMKSGINTLRYDVILDRGLAIEKALHLAQPGDSVMICGKGHEDYQEILGHRVDFCDRQHALSVLESMDFLHQESAESQRVDHDVTPDPDVQEVRKQ